MLPNKDTREIEERIRKIEQMFSNVADINLVTSELSEIKNNIDASIINCVKKYELEK